MARELTFPLRGEDKSLAVQTQAPYSTPSSLNMRAFDVKSDRGRGGTRPGLDRSHYTQLGGGTPIRLLDRINQIQGDNFDFYSDLFAGSELAANWSVGQFSALPTIEGVDEKNHFAVSDGTTHRGAVATAATLTDLDAANYRIEILIVPHEGEHNGTYKLHSRMAAVSPVSTTAGVVAELTLAPGGAYSGFLRRYVAGVLTSHAFTGGDLVVDMPGWFTLDISNTDTVKCYWRGNLLVTQTVDAAVSNRFGFSMVGTAADSKLKVREFRCQYFRTSKFELARARLYASAGGNFYRETYLTELEQVQSTCSLGSDRRISSVEFGAKLVIADNGVIVAGTKDGTSGTTSFSAASVADWASAGVNKYDHSLQILSGTGLTARNHKITAISGGTLTISGGGTSTKADATWRIVRNPKVYDTALADVLASGTNATTDMAGTSFDSGSYSDWTVPLSIAASQDVRYKVEIISGTGATPGIYDVTTVASGSLTLATSAGSNATDIVFKIYRDALNAIVATEGYVPLNCPIVARFLNRIYFAGDPANPLAWYSCRAGVLTDFDYGVSRDDSAAVAGATAEGGTVGEPIVDLCPWHRDKMMFACRSSLWLATADPRRGGAIQQVSQTIGLAARGAWCTGPNNELVFLSRDGIYQTASDCLACEPKPISRIKLPPELLNIGGDADVCMKYDVEYQGIYIKVTYKNSRAGVKHYWLDFASGAFWTDDCPVTMDPTAVCYVASADPNDDAVYFGCRDGRIRRYRQFAEYDDGEKFDSFVTFGPFRMADQPGYSGKLMQYQVSVPSGSGDHFVSIHPGKSAHEALAAAAKSTMTFAAGTSSIRKPNLRAAMIYIKHAKIDRPIIFEWSKIESKTLNEIK